MAIAEIFQIKLLLVNGNISLYCSHYLHQSCTRPGIIAPSQTQVKKMKDVQSIFLIHNKPKEVHMVPNQE
jgi:hypothetical protein